MMGEMSGRHYMMGEMSGRHYMMGEMSGRHFVQLGCQVCTLSGYIILETLCCARISIFTFS